MLHVKCDSLNPTSLLMLAGVVSLRFTLTSGIIIVRAYTVLGLLLLLQYLRGGVDW